MDVITGDEEMVFTLSYEVYRGYTIHHNEQGYFCLHGAGRRGCLQLNGKYVSFPSLQDAQNMVRSFRANGWSARQHMNRRISEQAYLCLNAQDQGHVA